MSVSPTTGCTLEIGTQATDEAADSYTEIANISQIGQFGDSFNLISYITLGDGRQRKQKGSANAGQLTPECVYDSTDAGQAALIAAGALTPAAGGSTPFNFRIKLADTPPSGPAPAPTTILLKGIVLGTPYDISAADDVVKLRAVIEIDTVESIAIATDGS